MPQNIIIVTHAVVGASLPEAALHAQRKVYLAWDGQASRLFVVQWDRVAWRCSCHKSRGCAHKLAVHDYVLALSQQRRMDTEDLGAHLDDEARTQRPALSNADQVVERLRNAPTPHRQKEEW